MAEFPQLTEEDFIVFTKTMEELLARSEAIAALLVEKSGHLIHKCGNGEFDTTTMATLASNSFNAVQFMASLINEANFTGMYQQGDRLSTVLLNVDDNCLVMIIFSPHLSIGAVRYYAADTIKTLAQQMEIAQQRGPGLHFDLTDL